MTKMKYSKDDYDRIAKEGNLEKVQEMYYTNKSNIVCPFYDCLLTYLIDLNIENDIMYWIFDIETDLSLKIASSKGNFGMVKYLIGKGANVNAFNGDALINASRNGHIEIVKCLIENGANVNINNDDALRCASSNGELEVVEYLIEKGADIHANNDNAFVSAAVNGKMKVMKFLIEKGSDIRTQNDIALKKSSEYGK